MLRMRCEYHADRARSPPCRSPACTVVRVTRLVQRPAHDAPPERAAATPPRRVPRSVTSGLMLAAVATGACSEPAARPPAIRFLHTFGRSETEVFNQVVAERGLAVEPMLVPFARGQQVISEFLSGQRD